MEIKEFFQKAIKEEKGQAALLLVVILLAILSSMGIGFLYRMRVEQRAVANYTHSVKAYYLAQAGIEKAIAELKNDSDEYDDLYEKWAAGFKEDLGEGNYSVYEAVEPEESKNKTGIFDEAAKININMVGGGSHNDGWTSYEVNLGAIEALNSQLSSDGIDNDRDGIIDEKNEGVEAIVTYRYGPDRAPGVKGVDDDKDNSILSSDGIDNDADGVVDEENEGIDEPDEFCPASPYGDDNPFDTLKEIRLIPGIGEATFEKIKKYLTIYSYDKNLDKQGKLRININKASASQLSQTLQEAGVPSDKANQIAVNMVDFRDEDSFPTEYEGKYGLEKTPYLNEVMPHFTSSVKAAVKGLIKGGVNFLKSKIKEKIKEKLEEKIKKPVPEIEEEIEKSTSAKEKELEKEVEKIREKYKSLEEEEEKEKMGKFFTLPGEKIAWAEKINLPEKTKPPETTKVEIEAEWIELFNPYEDPCQIKGWQIKTSSGEKKLYGKVPPRGYKFIFNIVITIGGKTIGEEILDNNEDTVILKNERGDTVDKATYSSWGAPWSAFEKNDPRLREFVSILPGGSPGFRNWFWMPEVGEGKNKTDYSSFYIKNKPFANVGELGFIHTGEEWQTIKLEQGRDWSILDRFTVADPPTQPVLGRININTAPRPVLEALPGIDSYLSRAIIRYGNSKKRPFNEPGELLEILLMTKAGSNGEDDDKDGYIDEEDENEFIFRGLSNLITTRSNCFTIISCGQVIKNEKVVAERKIKAVVDRGASPIRIKYYREIRED